MGYHKVQNGFTLGNYLITINNSKSIHTNCFPCKSSEDSSVFSTY